jgi:hypothetical protein
VVVNAYTVEAGVLATGDERRDVRQRSADGDANGDAKPWHLTSLSSCRFACCIAMRAATSAGGLIASAIG